MRKSVYNLSVLTLLALALTSLCRAQQATRAEPPLSPMIYGRKADNLPRKLTARGTIKQVHYAAPACGELVFAATLEIKLDAQVKGYHHPSLYLVVPCLYQPAGALQLLNRHVEIAVTRQEGKARPCFFDFETSRIDSKGLPFYCAHREEIMKAIARDAASAPKEAVEFEGTLEKESTYRAEVKRDRGGEWLLVVPVRMLPHHAVRVEWLNLKDYPALKEPAPGSQRKRLVFKVAERETFKVAGQYRWNTTYYCRIIALES
jgi:hypothetical protein